MIRRASPLTRRRGLLRPDLAALQSGTSIDVQGRISKAGDADVRRSLYEAASGLMTRFKGRDKIKSWGQAIAKRSCHRKASVAMARKLAVIMHAIWTDGTFYVGDPAASPGGCRPACSYQRSQAAGSASVNGATEIETHGAGTLTGAI